MHSLMGNVVPILFLILFGFVLRRIDYFKEGTVQGITGMVANLLIPCVIFTTFLKLNIELTHLWLAGSFALYQCILLAVGWGLYKAFRFKRRFYPFFHCAFAFGFMALPLFSTVFGEEHMGSLIAMGVGHELFVGLLFLTTAKLYLKNEAASFKSATKILLSPLFVMIFLALLLKFGGLKDMVSATVAGKGLIDAIAMLGSLTAPLTLMIVGYRISFSNRERIAESFGLVAMRYAVTFGIGYAFKWAVMDKVAGGDIYYDYAFFTLLSQHGSVVLTAFVGEYGTKEDLEVASNAFVINAIIGIMLYILFVWWIS